MPRIGLGTWPMSDAEVEIAVVQAIELGYRLVDTAYAYGNEVGVGRGLRASGLPREELFVTTKLNGEWHGFEAAQEALRASAARLGVDYLDLFLIHWPLPAAGPLRRRLAGLVKLLEDGRVRAIGVSNFKPAHLDRLLAETGVAPDVNQIQLDPDAHARREPRLPRRARHRHASPGARWRRRRAARRAGRHADRPAPRQTPAQVVLRWHVELGLWRCRSPPTRSAWRRTSTIFDFALTPTRRSPRCRRSTAARRPPRTPTRSATDRPALSSSGVHHVARAGG